MTVNHNILVIQLRQLGDILLTTPCLGAIKQAFPDSRLTFLAHEMGRELLSGNPFLDEIITYSPEQSIFDYFKLLRILRGKKFDLVFDFMNNPRSALMSLITGAQRRVGFSSLRSVFYSDVVFQLDDPYIVDQKFRLLRRIGIPAWNRRLILSWEERDLRPFYEYCSEYPAFANSNLRVMISPTHRRLIRRWPMANFVAIAGRLQQELGATIVWIWGPGEREYVQCGFDQVPNSLMGPECSLKELAGFAANCDLFVGNSNGPSHVSVAAGICTFELHGHTRLKSWCPMTNRHQGLQSSEFGVTKVPRIELIQIEDAWRGIEKMRSALNWRQAERQRVGVFKCWNDTATN